MLVGRIGLASIAAVCLTAAAADGQTISPHRVLGRYQQLVWQDQHGLPQNSVISVARTRDGYLWLATYEGAVRFDGVRFTVFDSSNTPAIRSNWINAVLEDRLGALWFGTYRGGLVRLADGVFTRYGAEDGLASDRVMALLEDRGGGLWIGTSDGGLSRFHDGRFTTYTTRDGLPGNRVRALTEDREGNVWIGTSAGLAKHQHGRFVTYTTRDGLADDNVFALCWDKRDKLWIGTQRGLTWFDQDRFARADVGEPRLEDRVTTIFEDREGSVWLGTLSSGLYRIAGRRTSRYRASDGLPADTIATIYQDPDGDLWVGTEGAGLSRLRDPRFRTVTTEHGLVQNFIRGIYEDSAGAIWIGTRQGLSRLAQGTITSFSAKDGLAHDNVLSIGGDAAGSTWIGTLGGLSRFRNGRFESWDTRRGLSNDVVVALLGDRAGNLWVGTEGGLHRFRDGQFTLFTTRDGLADDHIEALFEDREGSLWIGTNRGGMNRFKDGRFTSWSTKDGLPSNHVLTFYEDPSGGLWIATNGSGLSRFKDGVFRVITTRNGLYDNLAFRILEDGRGDVWMVCNRGIYRVSVQALNDFADGKTTSVQSFVYDAADGMLSREGSAGNPSGLRTRDGHLWFPTVAGVAIIDPARQNATPPLVAIEGVTLDRESLPARDGVHIMPGQESLEIHYTALSWFRPQRITFKYRLEGFDRDWIDAGTRRTAYYARVPPGTYAFRVIADNGEGIWNTAGKRLAVTVQPMFYQTWWFSAVMGGVIFATVAAASHYRIRQFRGAQAAQQRFSRQLIASQENERKRIAAELHDSLGQHLLIIKNRAVLGSASTAVDGAAQAQFDEIAVSAGHSLEEVRQIAYNLRPYHLDRLGLTAALGDMVDRVAASSGMRLEATLAPIDDLFIKDAEITIFRLVQESLNNIVKHSQASIGVITVSRRADIVTIAIEDDGRGFDAERVGVSPNGGFGLVGMAERVRILGGVLRIASVPGQGTTVTITLDASKTKDQGRHVH